MVSNIGHDWSRMITIVHDWVFESFRRIKLGSKLIRIFIFFYFQATKTDIFGLLQLQYCLNIGTRVPLTAWSMDHAVRIGPVLLPVYWCGIGVVSGRSGHTFVINCFFGCGFGWVICKRKIPPGSIHMIRFYNGPEIVTWEELAHVTRMVSNNHLQFELH